MRKFVITTLIAFLLSTAAPRAGFAQEASAPRTYFLYQASPELRRYIEEFNQGHPDSRAFDLFQILELNRNDGQNPAWAFVSLDPQSANEFQGGLERLSIASSSIRDFVFEDLSAKIRMEAYQTLEATKSTPRGAGLYQHSSGNAFDVGTSLGNSVYGHLLGYFPKVLLVASTLPQEERVLFRKSLVAAVLETVPVSEQLSACFSRPTGLTYFSTLLHFLHGLNTMNFLYRDPTPGWLEFLQEELYFRLALVKELQRESGIPDHFWSRAGQPSIYDTWASWFLLSDHTAKSPLITEAIKRRYMDTYVWFKERDCRQLMLPPGAGDSR